MMRTLALDQALRVSGYAVFDGNELEASGTFEIDSTMDIGKRLEHMQSSLDTVYNAYGFDRVVYEDIQLQAGNVVTYKMLAYAQAAVILWCDAHDIPCEAMMPAHWRKVLGGQWGRKRVEQKDHALELVREMYGKDVESDEADAICIGSAYLRQ